MVQRPPPLSGLSIALVVSVQSLYQDAGLAWIVTAVIGGSLLTEFLVTRTAVDEPVVPTPLDELEREAPIDERDDLDEREAPDGPIYRDEPAAPAKHGGHHE